MSAVGPQVCGFFVAHELLTKLPVRVSLLLISALGIGCGPVAPESGDAQSDLDSEAACGPSGVAMLLAPDEDLTGFVLHETGLYFSAPRAAEIRRLDLATDVVEVVASGVVASALAVGSDAVFWSQDPPQSESDDEPGDSVIFRMPLEGGASTEVYRTPAPVGLLAARGGDLYFEEAVDGCTSDLRHLPAGGVDARRVIGVSAYARELHVHEERVFGIGVGCDLGPSSIFVLDASDDHTEIAFEPDEDLEVGDPESIAMTDDSILWSSIQWKATGRVHRTSRSPAATETLVELSTEGASALVSGDGFGGYWVTPRGDVSYVEHGRDEIRSLGSLTGIPVWSAARDGTAYWATREFVDGESTASLFRSTCT